LAGCASLHTNYDLYFEPAFPSILNLNQEIDEYFIKSSSVDFLGTPPCVRPPLPSGLFINSTTDGQLYLSGTTKEIIPPTNYILKVKGDVEIIGAMSFTISIVQTTGSNCNNSPVCSLGNMKCVTDTSYQTCNLNANGSTYWDTIQNCGTGTVCVPSGNYIYCE
jgi:hypothetical protein